MMKVITELLAKLALHRPLFHSEADFQHAFSWELHQQYGDASLRLELPISQGDKQIYLDIWAELDKFALAIELKYKTRAIEVIVGGEQFSLKNQSAQDHGRYDFIHDVERLEDIVFSRSNVIGYAILLTNDSAYWKPPRDRNTVDADFRIHSNRILEGTMQWKEKAAAGTKKNRETPISLKGAYPVKWENYSNPAYRSYGSFRYLIVQVKN